MLRTSNIKHNLPQSRILREDPELLLVGQVPEHIRQLIIDNKRMSKRIQVLETEIQQKNRVINELKNHLDDGVVEYTQQKLAFYRNMDEEVQKKVKETKQKLIEESIELKEQCKETDLELQNTKKSLQEEMAKNSFLSQKIESLKEYIIDIIEQKDYLIAELGTIISQQEKKISKQKSESKNEGLVSGQCKRKAAFIKRNQ